MTTREVVLATGIGRQTIYKHLADGTLGGKWEGSRWNIPASEVYGWSVWMWERGRALMYPPFRVLKYIQDFGLE